jgi:NADH-quinone oxidoreductase subunit N
LLSDKLLKSSLFRHFFVKALITLSALAVLSLASQMFSFQRLMKWLLPLGLATAVLLNFSDWNTNASFFNGMLRADNVALSFIGVLLVLALFVLLLAPRFYNALPINSAESYAMQLFALCGATCMLGFGNLSMLFIGIELLSISSYVMAGSDKQNLLSNEAALKYFLMGSFASGFLLFGIALIYATTGSFDTTVIGQYASTHVGSASPLFYGGIMLLLIAMSFKASLAPFHFWAPDVYEGSPTLITLFLIVVVKLAAFGAFARLFLTCFMPLSNSIALVIGLIAVLTMSIGNLSAILQSSFKRMLAYSGVAHAGYLMLGILSANAAAYNAILYYVIAYGAASFIAFAALLLLDYQYNSEERQLFKGLAKQHPMLGVAVTIAMLSLAGIPPTAGFFGKYYLFSLAVQAGYTWVVAIAVINSLISVYYYFSIIINIYSDADNPNNTPLNIPTAYKIVVAIATIATLLLGIYPALIMDIR